MALRWNTAQFFEIRWWKNYLDGKEVQEYLDWKRDYWNNFIEKYCIWSETTGEKVMDAGCGPAGMFIILENSDIHALDPLLEDYEKGLDHFSPDMYPKVTFHPKPLEVYNGPKDFDTIFCLNAINHFQDMRQSLEILYDMAKPGADVFISIDAHNYSLLKWVFRAIPGDILHPHQHDRKDYIRIIENAGFKFERDVEVKREMIFTYTLLQFTK